MDARTIRMVTLLLLLGLFFHVGEASGQSISSNMMYKGYFLLQRTQLTPIGERNGNEACLISPEYEEYIRNAIEPVFGKCDSLTCYAFHYPDFEYLFVVHFGKDTIDFSDGHLYSFSLNTPRFVAMRDVIVGGVRIGQKAPEKFSPRVVHSPATRWTPRDYIHFRLRHDPDMTGDDFLSYVVKDGIVAEVSWNPADW